MTEQDRMRRGVDRLLDDLSRGETGVRLVPDELLLIDWTLCASSRILPGADDLDQYMKWERLRAQLWEMLSSVAIYLPSGATHGYLGFAESSEPPELYLELDSYEARSLLAMVPTTFRWGTAPDCGFSLKAKLSMYVEGVYRDPQRDQDQTPAQGPPESTAGDKATA